MMNVASGKIVTLVVVAALAAISAFAMWALDWTQKATFGLDINLWAITWFLALTAYLGLPAPAGETYPWARRIAGLAVILALGVLFTYVFKALTPTFVGGDVDEYPLMSLTYVAWVLVFLMLGIWLRLLSSRL